jgi:plasmid stabilization system protein ParE
MIYKVKVTINAEEDLDNIVNYLQYEKRNSQAASNLLLDFEKTVKRLSYSAGSIMLCSNTYLNERGYRRIGLEHYRYFLLYRIENDTVVIDKMFHELQDYENKMK